MTAPSVQSNALRVTEASVRKGPLMTTISVTEDQVLEALHDVYDPEIPVNIVDLGLIYDVKVEGPYKPDTYRY